MLCAEIAINLCTGTRSSKIISSAAVGVRWAGCAVAKHVTTAAGGSVHHWAGLPYTHLSYSFI